MASNTTAGVSPPFAITLPLLPAITPSTITTSPILLATLITTVIATLLLTRSSGPRLHPLEPPLLRPHVPLIGHILSLIRHQAAYHITLQKHTRRPIATLPMLWSGKMYAVWDPYLAAAGLRAKTLTTTPHILEVTPTACETGEVTNAVLKEKGEGLVERMMEKVIPGALKGEGMRGMNEVALRGLGGELSSLAAAGKGNGDGWTEVPNLWLFIRHLVTSATTTALYGPEHNPFSVEAGSEDALWTMERNLLGLTLGLPGFMTKAGRRARATLVGALRPFYVGHRDTGGLEVGEKQEGTKGGVSQFVRDRAGLLRESGIPDEDVAKLEIMLPFAAMANTVPLLFWLIGWVFEMQGKTGSGGQADVVERLRKEVEGLIVGREGDVVRLSVATSAVEQNCPLLMSCYKETQRKTVHQVSTRTVAEDTILRDRAGKEYLLKKGTVAQLVLGAGHNMEEYWGEDVDEFKPDRFVTGSNNSNNSNNQASKTEDGPGSVRAMRAAFLPFGGGSHLCPGRAFAFAEMMAVMATLLLGFDVQPLEGGEWKVPEFATRSVIDAVTKPKNHGDGFGVKLRRRKGWENAQWKYEL
ncbi:cytochrome P450 [Dichotomopilus funicola]|uniref:Cytochrome P450 n=1 Tax=Dichotomopilus funicola TaxID=1934379 RepID=A0AAN6VAA1_9PEZI|nr:cytochrome P450 [Dichotomopilus funicola]